MAGCRAEPNSTRKRLSWEEAHRFAEATLNTIHTHIKNMESALKQLKFNKYFALYILEKYSDLILKACQKCEYREFGIVLENIFYPKLEAFIKSPSIDNYKQVLKGYEEAHNRLNKMNHLIRYNRYQARMKARYDK